MPVKTKICPGCNAVLQKGIIKCSCGTFMWDTLSDYFAKFRQYVDEIPYEVLVPYIQKYNKRKKDISYQGKIFRIRTKKELFTFAKSPVICLGGCGRIATKWLLARDCNRPLKKTLTPHLVSADYMLFTTDHIIARDKGGIEHPSNYQPLCFVCNTEKGDYTNEQFFAGMRY